MRDIKTFVRDLIKKPPQLFPLVALFHIAMLIYTIWNDIGESYLWIQILWIVGYTIFWFFICDMRKWAAIGYLSLTVIDLILRFALKSPNDLAIYVSDMFILDVLFSFFVLFYYKRFD
ncbi:MAG: hypothetical protein ACTHJ0_09525 [Flavipsychrobacter sp.]